jgi:phage shock protein PspC (stress-responsive transcriptional regulator)
MDLSAITFTRQDDGRVVAGVASGFALRHGVDVLVVR